MKSLFYQVTAVFTVLLASSAQAADWQQEIATLREDVKVLQRQVYRGVESSSKGESAANADVQSKMTEWAETVRKINGRMDELEHKLKQTEIKLDKINRDMEIRFKILEGRPIPNNLSAPAPSVPQVYDAPVAGSGAKSVVGDKISGGDLAPLDGEQVNSDPSNDIEVLNAAAPVSLPSMPQTKVEDMYATAMQAYNSAYYDEAEIAFDNILKQHPKHALSGNAQYWLGEVYTKQGNLNKAKIAFKNGYQNYRNGNKAPDSLYRLGITLENLNEKQNACIVFTSFGGEFPKANADLQKKVKAESQKLGCK